MGDLFDIANLITNVGVDAVKIKSEPGLREKSSNEILTELFSTFDAGNIIDNDDESGDSKEDEDSPIKKKKIKKKHKHKDKKHKKKSKRGNSSDSSSDEGQLYIFFQVKTLLLSFFCLRMNYLENFQISPRWKEKEET